jgi:hypothetical protein
MPGTNVNTTFIKRAISNAEIVFGAEHTVNTRLLRDVYADAAAHVRRIRIRGTLAYNNAYEYSESPIALAPEFYPALYRVLSNISLEVAGHKFFRGGVDGSDVFLHSLTRSSLPMMTTDLSIDPGPGSIALEWVISFDRPFMPDDQRNDYALPLAVFASQDTRFAFTPSSASGVTGLTFTGLTGVSVTYDLVILDKMNAPTPWALNVQTVADEVATLYPRGGLEYLVLCPRETAGRHSAAPDPRVASFAALGAIDLSLDGESVIQAATIADLFAERLANVADPYSGCPLYDGISDDLPIAIPLVVSGHSTRISKLPRGTVMVRLPNRDGFMQPSRFMWFDTGETLPGGEYASRFVRALGHGEAALQGTSGTEVDRILPHKVYAHGFRHGRLRTKVARKVGAR